MSSTLFQTTTSSTTGDKTRMALQEEICDTGKAVILSLGGAAGAYGFSDDAEAKDFAHTIWNLFLGGSSGTRPLDDEILDGVDLDIEGGSAVGYPAFIAELRSLFAADTRKQYYNNYCETQAYGSFNFNFEQWDTWAKTISINKNVKVYLGVPASRTAANAGYVAIERLQEIMDTVRCKYSSFGGAGTECSIAAAKSLKRPRDLVCGGSDPARAPVPAPIPPPPPAPAPPPAVPAPPPVMAPPPVPVPPPSASPQLLNQLRLRSPVPGPPPVPAPAPTVPNTPADNTEPSQCPVKGAACTAPSNGAFLCDGYEFATCLYGQWILQACAPGTYCISRGCDFVKGPVLGCLDAEKAERAERVMRNQLRDAIDLMWGVFGHVNDPTWDSYAEIDDEEEEDDDDDDVPVASDNDAQNNASQQQQQPQQQQQKPFIILDRIAAVEAKMRKAKDISDDYLIDFIELENGPDFVSFALDPTEAESSKTFRTQVRIRTNNDAINLLWRVSFFVKPGETVKSVSRGTFVQNGSRIFVTSKPKEEAHKSMVVRFVIEGVRTADSLGGAVGSGTVSPDSVQQGPDLSAPQGLPDPAYAKFEHKAVKL
ncbi:Chitinase 1 [Mortierella sp. 14UC]|nr:Chitinase 1 [Mortierella sp. 14UC]